MIKRTWTAIMRHPILIKGEIRSPIRLNFQQNPESPSRSICCGLPSRGCGSKKKNKVVNIMLSITLKEKPSALLTYLATIKDGRSQFSKVTACADGEQEHHEETWKIKDRAHCVCHSKLLSRLCKNESSSVKYGSGKERRALKCFQMPRAAVRRSLVMVISESTAAPASREHDLIRFFTFDSS